MTLEQIKYVLAVEKEGSINQAASKIFVTQSALSMAIKSLEDELGYPIFLRTNRGVVPTTNGRTLITYLRSIDIQLDRINKSSYKINHPDMKSFVVATDGFACCSMIVGKLLKKYAVDGLQAEIYSSYGDESRMLVEGKVADIGVIRIWSCNKHIELRQMNTMGIEFHPLYEGDLAVKVGPGNPMYHDDSIEYVTPDMISNYPRIKYGCEERGPLARSTALGIKENVPPIITSSRAVINDMLAYTDGYYIETLLPPYMVCQKASPDRKIIPLKEIDVRSSIGWICRKDSNMGDVDKDFVDMLVKWFNGQLAE